MSVRPETPKRVWAERKQSGWISDNLGWAQLFVLQLAALHSPVTLDLKQISVLGGQQDCVCTVTACSTKILEISQMARLGRRNSRFAGGGGSDQEGQKAWFFSGGAEPDQDMLVLTFQVVLQV